MVIAAILRNGAAIALLLATIISPLNAAVVAFRAVNPPKALPQKATVNDLKWQPSLDFDTDGCYNVPAIDKDGNIAEGLSHHNTGGSTDCRDASDLDNNNVYARQRCNNGWCVYLYDYYFEKDVSVQHVLDAGGHRHDWEHIAVWVKNDKAEYVAASAHGKYSVKSAKNIRWDGSHPKIVYHKDGGLTHAFRFANAGDDKIENHKGYWFRGALVSYNGFPNGLRDKLFNHDFGKATMAIPDKHIKSNLDKARPSGITFDTGKDVGSPGNP
jgi:hypothetical protein